MLLGASSLIFYWEKTPRVRLSVLDPGHEDIVNRIEKEFPLERTQYTKLLVPVISD